MKPITVQLSAKTRKKLDALAAAGEIESVEKYVEDLIDYDLEDRNLEELLLEGLEGEATPFNENTWIEIKREVAERIEARKQAKHVESGKIAESPARYRKHR